MTDYLYDLDICFDPDNPNNIVRGGLIEIYDANDLEGTTLLQLKDTSGNPIPNPMTSNEYGVLGRRIASVPQCLWKSGPFSGVFNSYKGLRDEAVAARGDAQAAASAANQSALSAAEAAQLALGPTDEQVDDAILRADIPGQLGAAAPAVVTPLVEPIVVQTLAADPIPAQAAASAVATAMQGKQVAEVASLLEDTLSFAIVDEDGRQLWIQAGADGDLTQYTADKIKAKVAPGITADVQANLGVQDQPTAITGLSFVIVDEDGRILPDAQWGTDGKFTQAVIDSISARLVYPAAPADTSVQVIAPSGFSMVVGKTYKLYYADFITALPKDASPLTPGNIGNSGDYWTYTPAAAGAFTLTVKVVDRMGATIVSKGIPVTIYAAPSGTGKRHLQIGDSITRDGTYVGNAVAAIPNMVTVGTRTYNDGALNREGRGGWSLANYFTSIGSATGGDSPFLFPQIVANGAKFWGNTEFWRKVSYVSMNTLPISGYDFDGFQKMARNWQAMTADPVFDANGYPKVPAEGDVVVDPTKAAGSQWRQYTAGAWAAIATPTLEFSFTKYMQRYAAAYPNGGPTSIGIMLETNDFFTTLDDAAWATWKGRMDQVISAVRAWSATVPFIICLAPTGGPADKWNGQTVQKFEFDRRIKDASQRILAAYDTQANRDNKVFVSSFLGSVTPANMSDYVHPNPAGHGDMSGALAGTLAKLITEGA